LNLTELNNEAKVSFTAILADIFEHSPWVAEQAWQRRPFSSVSELHSTMVDIVDNSTLEAQLTLLKAHPELAGKEAQQGALTSASEMEQAGANLNSLNSTEMATIQRLNERYITKFGFPFIIAVRNHTKDGIFSEFERRLDNSIEQERTTALEQVAFIALFRLDDLLGIASA
jgi:2-oxo-4-hydroxy-4-carboxy-5-ureidoimidazoline decarboxylase